MPQAQDRGSLSHAIRLIVFQRERLAARHRAEAARPRTHVTQDHERGGFSRVAFRPVRAAGVLADRFQAKFAQQAVGKKIAVPAR